MFSYLTQSHYRYRISRTLFGWLLAGGGLIAICTIGTLPNSSSRLVLATLIVSSVIAIVSAFMWIGLLRHRSVCPEFLKDEFGRVYEQGTVKFYPQLQWQGQQARFVLFFENRVDAPAQGSVMLQPLDRTNQLRSVEFHFEVAPGELGASAMNYSVPAEFGGKTVKFELTAKTWHYQDERLLRLKEGRQLLPTGKDQRKWDLLRLAAAGAFGLLNPGIAIILALPFNARTFHPVEFPERAFETCDPNFQTYCLWRPGDQAAISFYSEF